MVDKAALRAMLIPTLVMKHTETLELSYSWAYLAAPVQLVVRDCLRLPTTGSRNEPQVLTPGVGKEEILAAVILHPTTRLSLKVFAAWQQSSTEVLTDHRCYERVGR